MTMELTEKTVFHFSTNYGGTQYNFSIPAESKAAAIQQLAAALKWIIEELDIVAKAGTRSN